MNTQKKGRANTSRTAPNENQNNNKSTMAKAKRVVKAPYIMRRGLVILQISQAELDVLLSTLEALLCRDVRQSLGLKRGPDVLAHAEAEGCPWDILCASNVYRQLLPLWQGKAVDPGASMSDEDQRRFVNTYGHLLPPVEEEVTHA